jgi:hypothetical protein
MPYSFDDVSSTSLTLCSKHRGTFSNATESFSEISASANKRHFEVVLVDMILLVGHGQNLTFVDIIYLNSLQDLRFDEMTDADLIVDDVSLSNLFKLKTSEERDRKYLRHYGDGYGRSDLVDHCGVTHARNASVVSNISWNSL